MKQMIPIAELDRTGLQTRAALNAEAIRDYAEILRENPDALPPVEVYGRYLADGRHRVSAALLLGLDEIAAEVHEGDHATALKAALKANVAHGMRRTNADKRQCMRTAWENRRELFGAEDPTERDFAEACYVSKSLAHNFYADMALFGTSKPVEAKAEDTEPEPCEPDETTEAAENPAPAIIVPKDCYGVEIPERIRTAFVQKNVLRAMRMLQDSRKFIAHCIKENDLAFGALKVQELDITIEEAWAKLKLARPYCVCRVCRGRGEGCRFCHGRGFQTKSEYNGNFREYKVKKDQE